MSINKLFEELCAILEVLKFHIKKLERENKVLKKDIKKLQEDITSILNLHKID